jgi:hypothetical protein
LALLATGCGRVGIDPSQVPEDAVGSSTDTPLDAPAMIKTVRVDTPTTVNAQSLSSSPLPLTAGNVVIAVP